MIMVHWLRRQRWWAGRIAVLPIHLLVFAIATFFLVRAIPGDPARLAVGPEATEQDYLLTRKKLGFDGSILTQLWTYLKRLAHGDLGTAISNGASVRADIWARLPGTFELALLAFFSLFVFALAMSFLAILRPRNVVARVIRAWSQAAGAIPEFVFGVFAIFIFYATLHVVPAPNGRITPGLVAPAPITHLPLLDSVLRGSFDVTWSMVEHLVLPIGVLVLTVAPLLMKQLIIALDDAMSSAPTLFKVAAGASRHSVITSAYRRALPSSVALFGSVFGSLLGGAVILETLFGLGGMGVYAVSAVSTKDLPALQGFLLVVAAISLVVFLLVDLINMMLDPRRKPGIAGAGA
jgi:peptide/nickel transport system permease protein